VAVVDETSGVTAHRPLIPAAAVMRELTPVPLILGVLLGVVFGASSLYLVLKVGLTVSASIPVAVISLTLFRILGRLGLGGATILENNIVQTAGSAGESIAFGLGVTMPAIMILGFDLEITRVIVVAVLGGLLGILMMIPLRRALIVQQHGVLKYPEGTACAEVLKAGATPEERAMGVDLPEDQADRAAAASGAGTIFTGFGIGVVYKLAMEAFKLWKDTPEKVFGAPLAAGSVSAEISPELLGVGYIIGPKIATTMAAGGVLAYLVLIPAIKFFGSAGGLILPPGTIPISQMGPDEIRGAYVLYIGAGAVATGGIISLINALPMIWQGLRGGLSDLRGRRDAAAQASAAATPRTDRDLPTSFVVGGVIVLLVAIMAARTLHMNLMGAVLIVLFGFLFVTVSSRLTGQIGSSSNPISGMTVATLLLTCLIFLVLGWTGPTYYVTALSVGGIVCIAASNGGTTSQDLKTGFLLGSTPRSQQIAILAGALASALLLGPILLKLNDTGTVYVPVAAAAPAAGAPAADTVVGTWTAPAAALPGLKTEKLSGPQAAKDGASYRVFQKTDDTGGPPGRYLVNAQGAPVYLVDPGINGVHKTRPDGTVVQKFSAPKATLMSYIIKGILNQQLPWTLVILGAMIALVLELCGIPSLAFAVGVYLPISSSSPVFIGGAVRWLVDRHIKTRTAHLNLSEAELTAEGDKSPGVLMASGYIAGGAIAGIGIAFISGALVSFNQKITDVMTAHNPFFDGPYSDALALLPFAAILAALYLAGRAQRTE
jgi:putative OPT family oligopeptide transporter